MDVQFLATQNDGHRYLLTLIDAFTKYLHIVPLKSKTTKAVIEAFESVLNDDKYMKPQTSPRQGSNRQGQEIPGFSFQ